MPGYELALLDEPDQPVADGEVGNLYVAGDSALAYYWHQHEKTKAAIQGDLFFTGDRYRRPRTATYVYEGRADDMIKIGGLWARPIEIENVLVEHPRVLEAAAVGVDADFTTRVKAFVICRGDAGDDGLVAELQEWCKTRLRRYEYPHFIDVRRRAAQDADRQDPALQAAGATHDLHGHRSADDFAGVETALTDAFRRSQAAARDRASRSSSCSRQEDLLGQRGAPGAILANALLSRHAHARRRGPRGERGRGRRRRRPGGPPALDRAAARRAAASPGELVRVARRARGQDQV